MDLRGADRWAKPFLPRPQARLRLFCLPWAGAGAAVFRRWMTSFPTDIEVRPIEYPGRGTREGEPFCAQIDELAAGLTQAVTPLLDLPYAVLGYSMGALVAFEWLRLIELAGLPFPGIFFACARRAPDAPRVGPQLTALPDRELLAAMESAYGSPPGSPLDPELLARALPALRADLGALENYRFRDGARLTLPIRACGGMADASVSVKALASWQRHTSAELITRTFPGGHFFIATAGDALREAIVGEMVTHLQS